LFHVPQANSPQCMPSHYMPQDDMMSQLRVARQKAADAEDDQLRAEEEAAVLRRELGVLQSQGSLGLSGPVPVAGDYGQQDSNAASLQVELDAQRARVTVLTDALSKLQVQAAATQAEVGQLKQQLQEAEGQAQKQLQRATQLDTALQALQHQSQQRQAKPGGTPAPGQQAGELQVLQLQLKQAHDQLAAADQQIKALQQKLAEAHAQVERAQADARAAIITASHHAVVSTAGSPAAAVKGSAASYATDDTDGGEAAAVLEEQVELLMNKLVVLKKSRDRMLAQLDRQSMENEQLLVESQVSTACCTIMPKGTAKQRSSVMF
jgi:chromosome segregation ATPase